MSKQEQELTEDNYYSLDANWKYMDVSTYKAFVGTAAFPGCEAQALAVLNGDYVKPTTDALLMGSYVDSYYDGTLNEFTMSHPELFSRAGKNKGQLLAKYQKCDEIIRRTTRDELFSQYMSGEKQVIMTGNFGGCKWRIKMDSYLPGQAIVDLKTVRDFSPVYAPGRGKLDFIRAYGYDIQAAMYQQICYDATGERLPFFIAAVTKEEVPDIKVIALPQELLDNAREGVLRHLDHVLDVKYGNAAPEACGRCDFCKSRKILQRPELFSDFIVEIGASA